jgi:hypothetical protein
VDRAPVGSNVTKIVFGSPYVFRIRPKDIAVLKLVRKAFVLSLKVFAEKLTKTHAGALRSDTELRGVTDVVTGVDRYRLGDNYRWQ